MNRKARELEAIVARYELEPDEFQTAEEKAEAIWQRQYEIHWPKFGQDWR